ncbi:DUF2690 domain-containing protein [Dactylosporangium sp. NPDC005555]|uniref:DUF2690 domain-containing protein n=1 Tax=Dactylosporangium sp. NPDC005555 TaxID=3154889 RepID=UPI0033A13DAD
MTGQNGSYGAAPSDSDRLTEFVADLAALRREAGQPSLRKMSGISHYSHTALSSVLSGARLPSQELTLAFVRACGGDDDAWRERWLREHDLLHSRPAPPVPPAGRVTPTGTGTEAEAETDAGDAGDAAPPARHGLALGIGIAALVVAIVVAIAVVTGVFTAAPKSGSQAGSQSVSQAGSDATTGASAPPAGAQAVADGSDPQEQRCQLDAVSPHTVPIPDAYGTLTLRYSPHCRAAWPLFVSTERVPTGATVRLRARRPSDGAVSSFDYPYMVHPQVFSVFGNVLGTAQGCVSVSVEVTAPQNGAPLATAETPCVQPS